MEGFLGIILLLLLFGSYFIPFIIARIRNHPNSLGIGLLNLLLGWTFLGWVIALVWAFRDGSGKKTAL